MAKTTPGRFFEDFRLGEVIRHATPRTVTTGDVALYTALYGSRFAVQSSDAFAQAIGYPAAPLDDLLVFHVVFGKTDGTVVELSAIASSTGGFAINGQGTGDLSGNSVTAAGDLNGDGLADVIVGAPAANSGEGRSYVVFGKSGTGAVDLSAVALGSGGFVIEGECADDGSGRSASAAGISASSWSSGR